MSKIFLQKIIICFFSIATLTACTRDADKASSLNFKVANSLTNSAQSVPVGFVLSHIVINVTGSGIVSPIIYNWDSSCHCSANTMSPPPKYITVSDIPPGPQRLIQFLGVYQDPTNEGLGMVFAYADKKMDLKPGEEAALLNPAVVGTSGQEKRFVGQYVTSRVASVGYGPTGRVAVKVQPTGGVPPMTLFYNEIFNGWYSAFMLDGMNFVHELVDQGGVISGLDSASLDAVVSANSQQMLKIISPDTYYRWYGGSSSVRTERGEDFYIGFMGPYSGASELNPVACYTPAAPIQYAYTTAAHTTSINWEITNSPGNIYLDSGGLPVANGTCTGATPYQNKMSVGPVSFQGGKDTIGGFKGPFKYTNLDVGCGARTDVAAGCYNSGVVSIAWDYVPNVFSADGINGVTLFTRNDFVSGSAGGDSDGEFRSNATSGDGYRCSEFAGMGFTNRGDFGLGTTTHSYSDSLFGSMVVRAFLCPYKLDSSGNKKYFSSAASIRDIGGTGGSPQLVWSNIAGGAPITTIPVTNCQGYRVELQTAGVPQVANANLIVSLTNTGGTGSFWSDSGCSTSSVSSTTIISGSSYGIVYFKPTTNNYFTLNASAAGYNGGNLDVASTSGAETNLAVSAPSVMSINRCYLVKIKVQNASSYPTSTSVNRTINLSHGGPSPGSFYSSNSCLGSAITNTTVNAGSNSSTVYFKALIVSGPYNITATDTNGTPLTAGSAAVNIGNEVLSSYSFNFYQGTSTPIGQCSPFEVNPNNSLGARINLASGAVISINISTGSGTLHYASDCLDSPGSLSGTIMSGQDHTQTLYYKGTATSTLTFDVVGETETGNSVTIP